MASQGTLKSKKASAVAARHRSSTIASTTSSGRQPVKPGYSKQQFVQAAADELSSDKGNVLFEDLKPGQRVFLNAFVLGCPFVFVPDLSNLQRLLGRFSQDARVHKEIYFAGYSKLRSEVVNVNPLQLQAMAAKSDEHRAQLASVKYKCEMLAVLRQLCFDEPIPLIDVRKLVHGEEIKEGEQSNTKARRIDMPATSRTKPNDVPSRADQSKPLGIQEQYQPSVVPCLCKDGNPVLIAGFPDDIRSPGRLVMQLRDILGVKGWLITSEAFLLKSIALFQKCKDTNQSALQQEYRDVYQASIQFIKQEGTTRSDHEWRQFITNCVHVNAMRHVLYDKELHYNLPGDNASQDTYFEELLAKRDDTAAQRDQLSRSERVMHEDAGGGSNHSSSSSSSSGVASVDDGVRCKQGRINMSYEEMEKLEDIAIYFDDCAGVPSGAIIDGVRLATRLQRAEYVCQRDLAAAKLFYAELTKSCKKTLEEITNLEDKAKIGIRQAEEDLSDWAINCVYWCCLRKALHGVPIPASLGRNGIPVDYRVQSSAKGTAMTIVHA